MEIEMRLSKDTERVIYGRRKMTQNKKVIEYMRNHGSITALEAKDELHIMRLAARIADLKKMGYFINSERVTVKTYYGKTTVARYSLNG